MMNITFTETKELLKISLSLSCTQKKPFLLYLRIEWNLFRIVWIQAGGNCCGWPGSACESGRGAARRAQQCGSANDQGSPGSRSSLHDGTLRRCCDPRGLLDAGDRHTFSTVRAFPNLLAPGALWRLRSGSRREPVYTTRAATILILILLGHRMRIWRGSTSCSCNPSIPRCWAQFDRTPSTWSMLSTSLMKYSTRRSACGTETFISGFSTRLPKVRWIRIWCIVTRSTATWNRWWNPICRRNKRSPKIELSHPIQRLTLDDFVDPSSRTWIRDHCSYLCCRHSLYFMYRGTFFYVHLLWECISA